MKEINPEWIAEEEGSGSVMEQLGSFSSPLAADMVDLTPDVSPITDNVITLEGLFRYVAFVGTTDGIEFNNIALDEISDIS